MVSTRRGASTAPPPQPIQPRNTLNQKPIRKAPAKSRANNEQDSSSAVVSKDSAPETRLTRAKKAEVSREELKSDGVAGSEKDERAIESTKPRSKTKLAATRAAKVTVRRALKAQNTAEEEVPPIRSRLRVKQEKEDEEPKQLPKSTGRVEARTVRSTRATKARPPPLSPKKISQVNKSAPRAVGANEAKSPPVKRLGKRGGCRRPQTTRELRESDENDRVEVKPVESRQDTIAATCAKGTAAPLPRQLKSARGAPTAATEMVSDLSAQQTTPARAEISPKPESPDEFGIDHEADPCRPDKDSSEDELLGDSTPMRRSSPVRQTLLSHASKQEVRPLATPARSLGVIRAKTRTPQTSRPYFKSPYPLSSTKTRTMIRADKQAFSLGSPGQNESDREESTILEQPTPTQLDDSQSVVSAEPSIHEKLIDEISDLEQTTPRPFENAKYAPSCSDESSILTAPEFTKLLQDETLSDITHGNESSEIAVGTILDHGTVSIGRIDQKDNHATEADPTEYYIEHEQDYSLISEHSIEQVDFSEYQIEGPSLGIMPWDILGDAMRTPLKNERNAPFFDGLPLGTPTEHLEAIGRLCTTDLESTPDGGKTKEMSISQIEVPSPVLRMQGSDEPDDTTLHVSEFIDIDSLSEPSGTSTAAECPTELWQNIIDDVQEGASNPQVAEFGNEADFSAIGDQQGQNRPSDASQTSNIETGTVTFDISAPHYAWPTAAFDVRRKSVPVLRTSPSIPHNSRPRTSDGMSGPHSFVNWEESWWIRGRQQARVTAKGTASPVKGKTGSAIDSRSASRPTTPARVRPTTAMATTLCTQSRRRASELGNIVQGGITTRSAVAGSRFRSPVQLTERPATVAKGRRGPRLHSQKTTPSGKRPETPCKDHPRPLASPSRNTTADTLTPKGEVSTVKARLKSDKHAATVAGPRFRTPLRPAFPKSSLTLQRRATTRKVPLLESSPNSACTPHQTTPKTTAPTPGQEAMTPHPAAPLRGIVALVEVYTNEGDPASAPFVQLLHRLGAKTTKAWSDRITHVVFKDGSPSVLQRVRIHNKACHDGRKIQCVNSRWVSGCDSAGRRLDESEEQYALDLDDVSRSGLRKRKSMEPVVLANVGGSIVRERQVSIGSRSLGRTSLGRASVGPSPLKRLKQEGDAIDATPEANECATRDERSDADQDVASSPATPLWIAAPNALIQRTAPINRVRKLRVKDDDKGHRRLTFFNGVSHKET